MQFASLLCNLKECGLSDTKRRSMNRRNGTSYSLPGILNQALYRRKWLSLLSPEKIQVGNMAEITVTGRLVRFCQSDGPVD